MIGIRLPFMKLRVTCKFTLNINFSLFNGLSNFVPKNCSPTSKWLRMFNNTVFLSWILLTEENQISVRIISKA